MHAIVRRYEGIDTKRTDELTRKVGESLTPRLKKLDGFNGYFLIEADNGVMSSVNFYDTSAHADESTRVVAEWLREEKLDTVLPNPPKITGGKVIVDEMRPGRNSSGKTTRRTREGPLAGLLYSLCDAERRSDLFERAEP
jgi:hypothetical protein